jgi:hypothetical protein
MAYNLWKMINSFNMWFIRPENQFRMYWRPRARLMCFSFILFWRIRWAGYIFYKGMVPS